MADCWHLITGEYPPQAGGVSDYTAALAAALAATGRDVHVWAPAADLANAGAVPGVTVHRLATGFDEAGLAVLTAGIDGMPPGVVLVQYVPHAFGMRAMNLRFCRWVQGRARNRRDDVRVMFHEPYYPFTFWPPHHNLLALVNRLMAVLLLSDIRIAYVSTGAWERRLNKYAPRGRRFVWLPIPSAIPDTAEPAAVAQWRHRLATSPTTRVVGHFGTYGALVARRLAPALSILLETRPEVRICLMGSGSEGFARDLCLGRNDWQPRVTATNRLPASEVAACLRACDVVLQPYADGASGRRTTLMAALVNAMPAVSNHGRATEPDWADAGAVEFAERGGPGALAAAVERLLDDDERRRRVGAAGRALYERRFAMTHTVETLIASRKSNP